MCVCVFCWGEVKYTLTGLYIGHSEQYLESSVLNTAVWACPELDEVVLERFIKGSTKTIEMAPVFTGAKAEQQ